MRIAKMVSVLAALVLAGFATSAQAITIDFEDLEKAGKGFSNAGGSYIFDDFTLTNLDSSDKAAFRAAGTENDKSYTGTTALYNSVDNGVTELVATDGSAFDLDSIDLSELATNKVGQTSVTFNGTYEDGTTVQQTFDLDGSWGVETFYFEGFDNVVSVTWTQTADYHQFDNISVVISPVPLPASSVLLGSVLGAGVLVSRRRRRKNAD